MNDSARRFLDAYEKGLEVDGGWKYDKALQQAKLDFTEAGLRRLDQLISAIRERAKPTLDNLQNTVLGRNFCSLIGFHLLEVVRRRSGALIEWHDLESARATLPPDAKLPDAPFARLVALAPDQGAAFLPVKWIEDQLVGNAPPESALDYISELLRMIERDGPAMWWSGMVALGRIASWQMMLAADRGAIVPLRLSSTAPTSWVSSKPAADGSDLEQTLANGMRRIETNPDGALWQVFAFDGLLPVENGKLDAVMVALRTYGARPLRLEMAFPYRRGEAGFEIYDPTVLSANIDANIANMLVPAMFRGIYSIKWVFGKTWDELRVSGKQLS